MMLLLAKDADENTLTKPAVWALSKPQIDCRWIVQSGLLFVDTRFETLCKRSLRKSRGW